MEPQVSAFPHQGEGVQHIGQLLERVLGRYATKLRLAAAEQRETPAAAVGQLTIAPRSAPFGPIFQGSAR